MYAVGLLVLAAIIGLSGGVGAVWALKASLSEHCSLDPVCYVAKYLRISERADDSVLTECIDLRGVSVIADLAVKMYAADPETSRRIASATLEGQQCVPIDVAATKACAELKGGNSGDPFNPNVDAVCRFKVGDGFELAQPQR